MGKRGFPPQPTALKIARGNPGKRPLNDAEPQFAPPQTQEPPTELNGLARETWDKYVGMLVDSGVLTEPDIPGFLTYCKLVQDEREWEELQKVAKMLEDRQRISNQLLKIRGLMKTYGDRYGLNPASRSQVKAQKPKDARAESRKRFLGGAA